ncbi:tail fiber assembly protein [Klebsiella quasipneumoniae]|uniref:tail fiber assembly protein n=1 Tax=Klebsiella quasipneumoniae TaxID=1463165 RepID=UPI00237CEDD5|nr:tail fiber assembly protein [Klebsiella quasipneumoniae]MDE1587987.1 tail fiber assembly protein [Klebsiella quasipneumoniae]MDE1598594.1 tail fiber assembly protein [Klebsiella quasipneumoniae]MDE1603890.1 tail fiber assembly protein [Klebsiella quasipneumoniae]MDE1609250.1 tail fiber assembly protein [Klebsiella quasipneumoniae]MDE1614654.1 tail fiber assembly protein [Klebsiella quasipneumoniae]
MSGDIKAAFDSNFIATQAGTAQVFHFDMENREFIGAEEVYIHVGVGLPAFSCLEEPPVQSEYQVAVRSEDNFYWSVTDDYRGITVYDIQTLASHVITEPGPIPDTVTTSAPSTPYDKWNGSAWVTDADAQHAADVAVADLQKKELIAEASAYISILQDAVALNMATDEEKSQLSSLQVYRILLNRVDTSLAPNIVWPVTTIRENDDV